MLILLPPSEAKATGGTGASLRAAGLSRPGPYGLGDARRPVLETVSEAAPSLFAPGSLLVDLRSTDYAALWQVTGPLSASVTPVRVLVERRVGRKWVRRTLSYQSKLGKGLLARELIVAAAAGNAARTPADVAAAGERVGYVAEPRTCRARPGSTWSCGPDSPYLSASRAFHPTR